MLGRTKRYNTRLQEIYRDKNGYLRVAGVGGLYNIYIRRMNGQPGVLGDYGSLGEAVAVAKKYAEQWSMAFSPSKDVLKIPVSYLPL